MKRPSYILIAFGTVLCVVAALIVLSGKLDRLSNDGTANSTVALQSIALYWLLGVALVLLVAKRERYWKQYLLGIFSAVICIACLELALRSLSPALALREFHFLRSSQHHHELMPDTRYHLGRFEGEDIVVQTNEDGLRSTHSREEFLTFDRRIVCLGDSFTFGAWVQDAAAYPQILESLLQETAGDQSVAVLNAGILSYSPLLEEQMLEHVVKHYRPHVVTLMLDCTDVGDDYHYSLDYDPQQPGGPFSGPYVTKPKPHFGALWRFAKPLHPTILAPFKLLGRLGGDYQPLDPFDYYKFKLQVAGQVETERFFISRHPLDVPRQYFDATWDTINRIAERCRQLDAEFILYVAPRYHHWNANESPENWETFAYGLEEPYQFEIFKYFDSKIESASFKIVNMLPAVQATQEYPLVFRTDPHWNPQGNRFVAHLLQRSLELSQAKASPRN
ncbi:MAG TPA: SGNH/GDSL hydrolase family protein [Planctomycetaceae bacterium]|nr:SGNH/GDSL hydrolase family protein [Planctomycetaceae bacterium]